MINEENTTNTWSQAPAHPSCDICSSPYFWTEECSFRITTLCGNVVWKKVVYVDRLLQLFRYVPCEQLTIPDFVFQHDLEVNGGKGLIVDPRTKYVYQRP